MAPVALDDQGGGLPGQLVQAIARRGVTRVGHHSVLAGEEVAETAQARDVGDLDGPEAQRPRLLPRAVDLDEAQIEPPLRQFENRGHLAHLDHLLQVLLQAGRADHVEGATSPDLRRGLQEERPPEAVVGVEVRDDDHLHVFDRETASPQVGQRRGAGLDQHGGVHDEAVPVAPRRGQEVARPEKGQLGHRVSANERKAATSMGSPTTAESGTGRRR